MRHGIRGRLRSAAVRRSAVRAFAVEDTTVQLAWGRLPASARTVAAWGADALLVKGDLVQWGRPGEWAAAASVLAEVDLPVWLVHGNHEVKRGAGDGRRWLDPVGMAVDGRLTSRDLPGVRLVTVDT